MNTDLHSYYSLRAPTYDQLYFREERQAELLRLGEFLREAFAGKQVLEIACGTGYWTQIIAESAHEVLATDLTEPMLQEARQKAYPRQNVAFEIQNIFDLRLNGPFDAAFGGFIWSHLRPAELRDMLDELERPLLPGSRVLFADNRFVAGSSTPIAHTDVAGNTYQQRLLEDGSAFLVLKNFPQHHHFQALMEGRAAHWTLHESQYYWLLDYTTQ